MNKLSKKWTIFCMHHSHTDIGYTDTQEEMEFHHIQFIYQVLDILKQRDAGRREWAGFKWNCESSWVVEKFLEQANGSDTKDFISYVKKGDIGISGSYLNLTELVSGNVLNDTLQKMKTLLAAHGVRQKSAITADINGYSWGFSDALAESGTENLLCLLHTHHGYHPTPYKQNPFMWVSPRGKKIFVWNGEHYLLGNELGLAQAGEFEYTIRDGLGGRNLGLFEKAEMRIYSYLETMENQSYPYDFVPVTASGMMTDNGPPSVKLIEFINQFNEKHADKIEIKMVTADEFFEYARANTGGIPEYSGDWTDWWADGVGSTPGVVAHYRDASRKYDLIKQLDPDCRVVSKEEREQIAYNLIFYAEHTWGYASSISEPWHPNVNLLDLRKSLFAQKANEQAYIALKKIEQYKGKTALSFYKDYRFKIINPHDIAVCDIGSVNMEILYGHEHFEIVDEQTGEVIPHQLGHYARGHAFSILAVLAPHEEKVYRVRDIDPPGLVSSGRSADGGLDGVRDLEKTYQSALISGSAVSPYSLENRFFKVCYEEGRGITSIYDKTSGKELIQPGGTTAFQPVYEVTPIQTDPCTERRLMGRNRKSIHTERDYGIMCGARVLEDGALYSKVELSYKLAGTDRFALILTAYKHTPRMDVDVRFHKDSKWEPENLYLSLPFTSQDSTSRGDGANESGAEVWMDKTGSVFRPRIDQIPGTCADFYAVQNGIAVRNPENSLLIALKDTPLVAMGDIKSHSVQLCGEGMSNDAPLYAWLMNNFWETNFKASLGGFYQFRFSLMTSEERSEEKLFKEIGAVNAGVVAFYMFDIEK